MAAELDGKEYIRMLTIIASISIGIPLVFFIWVYLESSTEQLIPRIADEYNMPAFISVSLIALILIIIGHKRFKLNLTEASEKEKLADKLECYQNGTTERYFSYSISAIFITAAFYITDFQPFAALFGIMIVLFSINNPNARKTVIDLKLKGDDKEILLKGLDLPQN